jgi:hypothetical protein
MERDLDKNKFGKLVRLLVLLKRICYDARSHERKKRHEYLSYLLFLHASPQAFPSQISGVELWQ